MKAFQVDAYGPEARFVEREVDRPRVGAGELLISVEATSLNPVDHKILTGNRPINPPVPAILHMDVAGTVAEVGAGVDGFAPGDRVYGCAGGLNGAEGPLDGALADFMKADADLIASMPQSLDFAEAAALPLVSITAWEALIDRAKIKPDQRILIRGGTGGVGHVAIQIAKARGVEVTATVSNSAKAAIARDLGADHVIDRMTDDLDARVADLTQGEGFDMVFDTVGGASLDRAFQEVKTSGTVCSIIGQNSHDLSLMHAKGLTLHLIFMLLPMISGRGRMHHGAIMREIAGLVDEGRVKPLLNARRYGFAEADAAHAAFAAGDYLGKIVLLRQM